MSSILPTKSNLIKLKKTIALSKQGQELLEKKKYILLKEKEKYDSEKKKIEQEYKLQKEKAFKLLQNANVDLGINNVSIIAYNIEIDNEIDIKYKTVMGVEIPEIAYNYDSKPNINFGLLDTTISVDEAIIAFKKLKILLVNLTRLEIIIKRLNNAIEKVQKRSNSLKDIIIPNYEKYEKHIQEILEERDREEFTRMKMIKIKIKLLNFSIFNAYRRNVKVL